MTRAMLWMALLATLGAISHSYSTPGAKEKVSELRESSTGNPQSEVQVLSGAMGQLQAQQSRAEWQLQRSQAEIRALAGKRLEDTHNLGSCQTDLVPVAGRHAMMRPDTLTPVHVAGTVSSGEGS